MWFRSPVAAPAFQDGQNTYVTPHINIDGAIPWKIRALAILCLLRGQRVRFWWQPSRQWEEYEGYSPYVTSVRDLINQ